MGCLNSSREASHSPWGRPQPSNRTNFQKLGFARRRGKERNGRGQTLGSKPGKNQVEAGGWCIFMVYCILVTTSIGNHWKKQAGWFHPLIVPLARTLEQQESRDFSSDQNSPTHPLTVSILNPSQHCA